MLNTRDKILISLTAVFQAVYGAVFIYRMFAWKTLIAGGESDLLELEISLAALFAVTVIFSVIMRNLPAKYTACRLFAVLCCFSWRRYAVSQVPHTIPIGTCVLRRQA